MKSRTNLLRKYKRLRADLAKYLPNLSLEDFFRINRATVTIRRIERETEAQADQEGGNNVNRKV